MHEPLAGWAVALGDAVTATDAAGRFVFRNVTPPYDVAFRNPGVPNTTSSPDVWLYRGLTRSDPTLQPGYVLGNHEGHAYFVSGKVTAADGGEATLSYSLSFGSPYVTWTVASGAPFGSLGVEMRWFQTPAPAALHLLTWAPNSDPLSYEYLSYREETFATVSDVVSAGRTLDFTPNAVETATYSAIVTAAWGDARTRRILYPAVVFDDHATHVLRGIVYDTLHSNPVGLGLPVLPGAHAVFLAFQGDLNPLSRGPFGAAHRVAASPDTPVTLDLPEPRTLLRPGADATIGAATEFA
jgi:hypothetical protein